MPRKQTAPNFEASMQELENLVDTLESGEMSLEDSLKSFEKGVELIRVCQKALDEAERKVEILTGKNAELDVAPFPVEDQ